MQAEQHLVEAAARLARSNSQEWKSFLSALSEFDEELREKLVMSPVETMQLIQGKAQLLAALRKNLENCIVIADKIQKGTK